MWLCSGCRSAYLDPRPDEQSIGAAYSSYYTHGDDLPPLPAPPHSAGVVTRLANGYRNAHYRMHVFPEAAAGSMIVPLVPPVRRAIDLSLRYALPLDPDRPVRVLDVGCGDGKWIAWLRDRGWDVAGAEPDAVARARAAERGLDVRCGGIEAWDDGGAPFDVVTMSHVIEHVHRPLDVLDRARRMLRPGGRLFVETPNVDALGHRVYGRHWRGLEPPRHLVVFSRRALAAALRKAGFAGIRFRSRQSPMPVLGMVSALAAAGVQNFDDPPFWVRGPGRWLRLRSALSHRRAEFLTVTCDVPE